MAIIKDKIKNNVVDRIFKIWLAYFGAPKTFSGDCGGEFSNDVFQEMIGIETSTTPGNHTHPCKFFWFCKPVQKSAQYNS